MNQLTIANQQPPVAFKEDDFKIKINSGTGSGFDCIRIKSKMFYRHDGPLKLPAGTKICGVIVGALENPSRVYYEGSFTPGQTPSGPICASCIGTYPDVNIENPVAAECSTCPKAQWGSKCAPDGTKTKGKACKEYMRIVIYVVSGQQKKLYRLDVPTMSMENLIIYNSLLEQNKTPIQGVFTTITFDLNCEYAKLIFDAELYVDTEQYAEIKEVMDDKQINYLLNYTSDFTTDVTPYGHVEEPEKSCNTNQNIVSPKNNTALPTDPIKEVENLDDVLAQIDEMDD